MDSDPPLGSDYPPPASPAGGQIEQSFSTSLESGFQLVCIQDDSVVVVDTGATANLVCFRWLRHHNSLLALNGLPRVSTYPAQARFKFGDGRTGNVCFAADITVGIAGTAATFTALVLDAEIPALLRNGAIALAGQLDFVRNSLTLGSRGIEIPLQVNAMGHYVLSVVNFNTAEVYEGAGHPIYVSFSEWAPPRERPNFDNGGVCLPCADKGLCSSAARLFSM